MIIDVCLHIENVQNDIEVSAYRNDAILMRNVTDEETMEDNNAVEISLDLDSNSIILNDNDISVPDDSLVLNGTARTVVQSNCDESVSA